MEDNDNADNNLKNMNNENNLINIEIPSNKNIIIKKSEKERPTYLFQIIWIHFLLILIFNHLFLILIIKRMIVKEKI